MFFKDFKTDGMFDFKFGFKSHSWKCGLFYRLAATRDGELCVHSYSVCIFEPTRHFMLALGSC